MEVYLSDQDAKTFMLFRQYQDLFEKLHESKALNKMDCKIIISVEAGVVTEVKSNYYKK